MRTSYTQIALRFVALLTLTALGFFVGSNTHATRTPHIVVRN